MPINGIFQPGRTGFLQVWPQDDGIVSGIPGCIKLPVVGSASAYGTYQVVVDNSAKERGDRFRPPLLYDRW